MRTFLLCHLIYFRTKESHPGYNRGLSIRNWHKMGDIIDFFQSNESHIIIKNGIDPYFSSSFANLHAWPQISETNVFLNEYCNLLFVKKYFQIYTSSSTRHMVSSASQFFCNNSFHLQLRTSSRKRREGLSKRKRSRTEFQSKKSGKQTLHQRGSASPIS